MSQKTINIIYIALVAILTIAIFMGYATSPIALLTGLIFALVCGKAYPNFNKTMSKKLLQYSVIGLGFGMNVYKALESGSEGMMFTIVSVFGTLALGWFFGKKLLKVDSQTSYLISSGTAICGGSAIAAVGPVIKAKAESMSVALGVVFILNAIALFIFPSIGDMFGMSMKEFGMWAAIAIHDTSSVVGAGAAYDQMHPELITSQGVSALEVATTIKLTRALWIVVLAIVTPFFFKSLQASEDGQKKPWYKTIPTFIIWFVVAIIFNTYVLSNPAVIGEEAAEIGTKIGNAINNLSKHLITLSLFFIGAGLTRETLKAVGIRPLVQGVLLWISISCVSLAYILLCN
ncbi:MAG: putative sulfate exporter family transporter [Bacteroidales bacterium]|nr:putative sulfate exporter family transporter [Bacteroidales bacterium]